MFSYLDVLSLSAFAICLFLAYAIGHDARKEGTSFWHELTNGSPSDYGALVLCQVFLTAVLWVVLSVGNAGLGGMYPSPTPTIAVKLGPVYNITKLREDNRTVFGTTYEEYYEEEGFEFEWTEGEENNLKIFTTPAQYNKIYKEFASNRGKSHWITFKKDTCKLVSFYPAE